MDLSKKWLADYVDLDIEDREFAEAITISGSKVESYKQEGEGLKNIVVGHLLSLKKHENADKLWVCQVDCGGDAPLQIVTAAQNLTEGDYVPVALHNSVVAGGTKITKGKLMCPTIHGNMLVGPTAEDLTDKLDKSTNKEGLDSIAADVRKMIPNVNLRDTITQYSGLRPQRNPEGLNIDMYDDLKGYVNISGVRSTGLTNSVAVAKYVADLLIESGLEAEPKTDFIKTRKGTPHFVDLSAEEKAELIAKDPRYGNVICRCETITEGQICDAIHRTLGATTVDGVKRRLRAGMGRCQGGFCGPRVIEIIARELGISADEVCKNDEGSEMLTGFVR